MAQRAPKNSQRKHRQSTPLTRGFPAMWMSAASGTGFYAVCWSQKKTSIKTGEGRICGFSFTPHRLRQQTRPNEGNSVSISMRRVAIAFVYSMAIAFVYSIICVSAARSGGGMAYSVTSVQDPTPILSVTQKKTNWNQVFNPTWVQPTPATGNRQGLLVRSQNCSNSRFPIGGQYWQLLHVVCC